MLYTFSSLGMVLPVKKHKHTNDSADNLAHVCDVTLLSLFHPLTISAWLASSSRQRQVALATSLLMKEKGSLQKIEEHRSDVTQHSWTMLFVHC